MGHLGRTVTIMTTRGLGSDGCASSSKAIKRTPLGKSLQVRWRGIWGSSGWALGALGALGSKGCASASEAIRHTPLGKGLQVTAVC
jgi:hypothetical protein